MELSRSNYGRFRIQSLYVQIGRAPLPERPVFATCSGSRRHHTEQPNGTQAPIGHCAKDRGRRGSGLVQRQLCRHPGWTSLGLCLDGALTRDFGDGAQGFVYRLGVREHLCNVRVQYNDIRALGVPISVFTAALCANIAETLRPLKLV